jgi:hypothetical protein
MFYKYVLFIDWFACSRSFELICKSVQIINLACRVLQKIKKSTEILAQITVNVYVNFGEINILAIEYSIKIIYLSIYLRHSNSFYNIIVLKI